MDNNTPSASVGLLENKNIRLEYLTNAGPRIVSLQVHGHPENLLASLPTVKFETPYGVLSLLGGHRLWHSPEAFPRTYIPDSAPIQVDPIEGGVRLTQATEIFSGIQKIMEIRLEGSDAAVRVDHRLINHNAWAVELAAWPITMFPLGGIAVLPDQPEDAQKSGLLPDRRLTLWPYAEWSDPRLHCSDRFYTIEARPKQPAIKIGYANRVGWAGYYRQGVFFRKRIEPRLDLPHPDYGCNIESYCNDVFLELESVGPLTRLDPEQGLSFTEWWDVYPGLDYPASPDGMQKLLKDLSL